jgi:hypothetical protein
MDRLMGKAQLCRSDAEVIAPNFFVGRKISHRALEADLAFFQHIGTV